MIDKGRGGTLALGTRDTDGLATELAQEQVGLRRDCHAFCIKVLKRNARRLDDDVVVIHRLKITISVVFHTIHLVLVGNRNLHIRQIFIQKTQGRPTLTPKAEDK